MCLRSLRVTSAVLSVVLTLVMSKPSLADEGGAGLYLSGAFGSLGAIPGEPGWSVAVVYFHSKGAFGLPHVGYASERTDQGYGALTYTFDKPVLGGQLALGMVGAIGRVEASISGVGGDSRFGYNDVVPSATMRWNAGVNNYMVFGQGVIPVGTYNPFNFSNFGIGHGGIVGGAGYTYFDQKTGYEFSVIPSMTYNLKNTITGYQNGIDADIDWGASKFLSKDLHVGLVGYYYQQLTPDIGQPPIFGDFKSRVVGVGPQIGYLFPIGDAQGYVNLKFYQEFAAENRPAGLNAWLTFVISPKASEPTIPRVGRPPLAH
jgi:hypothetical protein